MGLVQSSFSNLDAASLTKLYRRGEASPVEAGRGLLHAIAESWERLNAFVELDDQRALADAHASEERWRRGEPISPFDGCFATIKTNIAVKGLRRQQGSRVTPSAPMEFDSPAVARLREAGVIVLGSTAMPEFGWKGLSDSPLTGRTPNPWNSERSAGGSSSGAAVAAAHGLGQFHLGTDGAGSVRIPAAFCGVFGLKPSYGRVAAYPASLMGELAHLGPLTRTVGDAAAMMTMIARPDLRDNTAMNTPSPDYRIGLDQGIAGLRIGVSRDLGFVRCLDPSINALLDKAMAVFTDLGAHVEEASLAMDDPWPIVETLWFTGASLILSQYDSDAQGQMDPGFVAIARAGQRFSGADYLQALFPKRNALVQTMNAFHQRYDLLITPQIAVSALPFGSDMPPKGHGGTEHWDGHVFSWTPYTYPFNISQQPAASVPMGFAADGLPAALQIVAPFGRDDLVLQAARAYEGVEPWRSIPLK